MLASNNSSSEQRGRRQDYSAIYFTGHNMTRNRVLNLTLKKDGSEHQRVQLRRKWAFASASMVSVPVCLPEFMAVVPFFAANNARVSPASPPMARRSRESSMDSAAAAAAAAAGGGGGEATATPPPPLLHQPLNCVGGLRRTVPSVHVRPQASKGEQISTRKDCTEAQSELKNRMRMSRS